MSDQIVPIVMPKWGLSMREGTLVEWLVEEGDTIEAGDGIMEIESDKIANTFEAPDSGLLRRCVGEAGEVYPVQMLLGVLAPAEVSDADIDAYVDSFEVPEVEEEEDTGPVYEFADLAVGRIRYTARDAHNDGGGGTPVIFIHGFGGDLDNWLFNIDAVSQQAPVYALDLPGHGQSVKSIDNPSLSVLVDSVVQLMDELDIAKAHLVGHSMGGLVSGKMAENHADRVASLTLLCTAGLGDDINWDYIDGFVTAESRKQLKPHLKNLFDDDSLVSRSMVDDLLKYKRLDGVQPYLSTLRDALFKDGKQAENIASSLASFEGNVHVVWGKSDAIIPESHASAVGGTEVTVIDDAGHMVMMEDASKVNDIITAQL